MRKQTFTHLRHQRPSQTANLDGETSTSASPVVQTTLAVYIRSVERCWFVWDEMDVRDVFQLRLILPQTWHSRGLFSTLNWYNESKVSGLYQCAMWIHNRSRHTGCRQTSILCGWLVTNIQHPQSQDGDKHYHQSLSVNKHLASSMRSCGDKHARFSSTGDKHSTSSL